MTQPGMKLLLLTVCYAVTVVLAQYNAPSIRLRLYDGNTNKYIEANISDSEQTIFKSTKYVKTQITVFVAHGFQRSADLEDVTLVADAFLKRGGFNVIGIDWRDLAIYSGNIGLLQKILSFIQYPTAANNTQTVGKDIATLINRLNSKNILLIKDIVCIGHSLGAQICGVVGRNVNSQFPVIIGLDPASLFFDNNSPYKALSNDDAKIVQLVHTDGGVTGTSLALGTASFYVNGGVRSQPGCGLLGLIEFLCSHDRSFMYFAEAVSNPASFPAVKCKPFLNTVVDNCNCSDYVYMGYPPDGRASGKYYLDTNSKSPFGKGFDGIGNCKPV